MKTIKPLEEYLKPFDDKHSKYCAKVVIREDRATIHQDLKEIVEETKKVLHSTDDAHQFSTKKAYNEALTDILTSLDTYFHTQDSKEIAKHHGSSVFTKQIKEGTYPL